MRVNFISVPVLVLVFCLIVRIFAANTGPDNAVGQSDRACSVAAIEKQHRQIARQVLVLEANFATFDLEYVKSHPDHAPRRDSTAALDAIWSPNLGYWSKRFPKAVVMLGVDGCVIFAMKESASTPPDADICPPSDKRIQYVMESLRERWENSIEAAEVYRKHRAEGDFSTAFLASIHNEEIPILWAEEKTLYCVLRPDSSYIDLNDSLQSCTPSN